MCSPGSFLGRGLEITLNLGPPSLLMPNFLPNIYYMIFLKSKVFQCTQKNSKLDKRMFLFVLFKTVLAKSEKIRIYVKNEIINY